MGEILLLFFCSVLFASNQVYGGTEYRLGGKGGNDWQAALTEASIYQVLDADGQEIRQKPVGLSPFGAGADTLIHFSATSILPLRIDPEVNIAQGRCRCRRLHLALVCGLWFRCRCAHQSHSLLSPLESKRRPHANRGHGG